MSKYSLLYLDDKMIFDQTIFQNMSCLSTFSYRLKRIDDFELSIEIENIIEGDLLPLHELLNEVMSVFAAHFWNANSYKFREMQMTNIPFDRNHAVAIDIILIKSGGSEIKAEFFIYQGSVNLYDTVLFMQSV
ncbi:hypothetical protein [Flectobacillus roseus]|uniref:hypothetical protein n=1 Tax=Flectobacillus roseus TaxID=502259 RepID=UPI0024B64DDF|nr:hypothetical protein [Flectobacillus roseus]MDI9871701.1 hypothetical protein [Flectobacillus roseus]